MMYNLHARALGSVGTILAWLVPSLVSREKEAPELELRVHSSFFGGGEMGCAQCRNHFQNQCINCKFN